MLRTTDHDTQPASTRPASVSDPLLRLQHEPQSPTGPAVVRCINHPQELALGGIPVICSACRARRDWLLINQSRHVFIRCRCGNEWPEPELTRAAFDAMLDNPQWTTYATTDRAINALGFDGALAGTYLL